MTDVEVSISHDIFHGRKFPGGPKSLVALITGKEGLTPPFLLPKDNNRRQETHCGSELSMGREGTMARLGSCPLKNAEQYLAKLAFSPYHRRLRVLINIYGGQAREKEGKVKEPGAVGDRL